MEEKVALRSYGAMESTWWWYQKVVRSGEQIASSSETLIVLSYTYNSSGYTCET